MNPEVPPYLALGELQRRETANKQMATAQGAAQGPQPSIKEQMEQKAGLMAAQGLQQQQAMQQMQQPQGGLPIPAGVPQPESQPEVMAAASGGLAHAPVDFKFQHGGIVAFAEGDTVEDPRRERKAGESFSDFRKRMFDLDLQLQRDRNAAELSGRESERQRRLAERGNEVIPPSPFMERPPLPMPSKEPIVTSQGPGTPVVPRFTAQSETPAPIADLKALADQQRKQQAPRPAAAPAPAAAAPAQPAPSSMDAMLRAQLENAPKERTMDALLAEQRAAREGAGMTEPAGQAQMARIKAMQEQYESGKPSAMDDLIRVFGQAGQYKGLSGTGPAYTANQQQKRSQDLAMAQKINELMGGVETTQRTEMKDVATGALSGLGVDRAAGEAFRKEKLGALGTGRTADIQAESTRRGQDLMYKSAMAQVAATAARNNMELTQNQKAMIADKAMDNVSNLVKATPLMQAAAAKDPSYLQSLVKKETERLMSAAGGTTIPAAPDATSSGGTTLKYNPKTGKIE
jgi:hypothetical protein